jgi:hypothetical protein
VHRPAWNNSGYHSNGHPASATCTSVVHRLGDVQFPCSTLAAAPLLLVLQEMLQKGQGGGTKLPQTLGFVHPPE